MTFKIMSFSHQAKVKGIERRILVSGAHFSVTFVVMPE